MKAAAGYADPFTNEMLGFSSSFPTVRNPHGKTQVLFKDFQWWRRGELNPRPRARTGRLGTKNRAFNIGWYPRRSLRLPVIWAPGAASF